MFKKIGFCVLLASALVLGSVDSAYAQRPSGLGRGRSAPQTINFTFGIFSPNGEDGRVEGDVLLANQTFLIFDIDEFQGATFGGEYLFPIGNYFEGGAGISYSKKTVPSIYADYIDSDGTEIDQELRLRLIPWAFTFRALPLGQANPFQPYVGGGLGVFSWKYTEEGEFVDFAAGQQIFTDIFEESGTEVGPVILFGARYAGDAFSVGGELRWHWADADLSTDFAGPKLDLGGMTFQVTLGVRFD